MSTDALLGKLFEIERAIGIEEPSKIRTMVIDAQDSLFQMQRELLRSSRQPRHSHQCASQAFRTVGA